MRPILAALASMPGRPLEATLRSLVGQADALAVCLNGYDEIPPFVAELDCRVILDPENARGAEGKLAFADAWDGIYLACDDDFAYGPEYAAKMRDEVCAWNGRALVSMHGRTYLGAPENWRDWHWRGNWRATLHEGRFINYLGTGVMAFDSGRLAMPTSWPVRNACDPQVSVWAQRNGVPIWIAPHRKREIRYILDHRADTIFRREAHDGFRVRTRLLTDQSRDGGWRVHRPEAA